MPLEWVLLKPHEFHMKPHEAVSASQPQRTLPRPRHAAHPLSDSAWTLQSTAPLGSGGASRTPMADGCMQWCRWPMARDTCRATRSGIESVVGSRGNMEHGRCMLVNRYIPNRLLAAGPGGLLYCMGRRGARSRRDSGHWGSHSDDSGSSCGLLCGHFLQCCDARWPSDSQRLWFLFVRQAL